MKRLAALIAILAVIAAACGSGVAGPGEVLAYDLATAGDVEYDVAFDMDVAMDMTGMEELEGGVGMEATFVGSIAYDVEPGPESGQIELTITSDFVPTELRVDVPGEDTVTFDDPDEIAATGEFDPEEFAFEQTFIIDETGAIVDGSVDGVAVPLDLLQGGFGGFGASTNATTFLGPVLPDDAVSIGDEWTTVAETPLGEGGPSIVVETVSRLDREETVDGRRVLVIVSRTKTSGVDIDSDDLADLVAADPTISQEERDAFGFIDMSMKLMESEGESTTWFDPAT
ncbi:MAG: hypothetical protein HKO87_02495, partial [Acidimicrobiia bacterium]|nr:hypothetical protein [Acidimicrobiia bacterium]